MIRLLVAVVLLCASPAFAASCRIDATARQIIDKVPEAGPVSGMQCRQQEAKTVPGTIPGRIFTFCEKKLGKVRISVSWDDGDRLIGLDVSGSDLGEEDKTLARSAAASLLQAIYSFRNNFRPADFKQKVETAIRNGADVEITADPDMCLFAYVSNGASIALILGASRW